MQPLNPPIPCHDLIPHRAPMLLVDHLTESNAACTAVCCESLITEAHVLLKEGSISPLLAIELFAQAGAAMMGLRGRQKDTPVQSGALLGCRELRCDGRPLLVGDQLRIQVNESWGAGQLAQLACTLFRNDEEQAMASAHINVAIFPTGEGPRG